MLNQAALEFFPTFFAVSRVLLEDCQIHQVLAVDVAQGIEVDELFAQEQLQQFPGKKNRIGK